MLFFRCRDQIYRVRDLSFIFPLNNGFTRKIH